MAVLRVISLVRYTCPPRIFFFFLMIRRPPRSPLFPYPTLFQSCVCRRAARRPTPRRVPGVRRAADLPRTSRARIPADDDDQHRDRASAARFGEHGQDTPEGEIGRAHV